MQPTTLLYWESLLLAKNRDYKEYDLGGLDLKSKDSQTINRNKFKMRWGGKIVELKSNVNFLEWIYWKFLRHYLFIRKIKCLFIG